MINLTHKNIFREFLLWLTVMLTSMVVLWLLPEPDAAKGLLHYAPLHTSMEMVSIAISAMIFGVSWVTQKYQPDGRVLALGVGFLGVALFDWSHALSNTGMPDFITGNDIEKSINFWLMARLFAGLIFLLVAFWPTRLAARIGYQSRYWSLMTLLLIVGVVHFALLYFQASMPRTFIEGSGLTDFKIDFEYFLIVLYVVAGVGFLLHARGRESSSNVLLALASLTMAMSEFFFTLYANVADAYNFAGHIYKIIAYGFLYRGLFLVSILRPYEALKESELQYAATLDTLPDLLFEVDRQGVYRAVHARKVDKLAAPVDTIIGKYLDEMLPPEAAGTCFEAIRQADRTGSSHGHRIKLEVPEGQRYFELSIAKKTGGQADSDMFLVLSRDITTTVQNEEKLSFEAKLNGILLELQEHAETDQKAEFLQRSLELVQKLVDSPVAFVYSVHEDQTSLSLLGGTQAFRSQASQGHQQTPSADKLVVDTPILVSELGAWANVITAHLPIVKTSEISDADTKGLPSLANHLIRFVSVPVIEDNHVRLVLIVADKMRSYSEEEVNALQLFATTLWSMLKQNSKNLTINLLTEALEQSPHSIVITDTATRIQYVNRAFSEISGYSLQEVIGKNPSVLSSGDTSESLYRELWKRLNRGQLKWTLSSRQKPLFFKL